MKKVFFGALMAYSSIAGACPDGQHSECILPRPWGGCAQSICVPNVDNPFDAIQRAIDNKALDLAISGRDSETIKNREDCIVMVTAALAVWGTTQGGPIAGIAAGAAGAAASSMACRRAFPL